LLSPRSERSEVPSLQSDEKIVPVGTNERLAPADLLGKARAQALMKRCWRGHITQYRSILDSNAPTSSQGRIQAFSLRAQSDDALRRLETISMPRSTICSFQGSRRP
jgi:hypothetical protein